VMRDNSTRRGCSSHKSSVPEMNGDSVTRSRRILTGWSGYYRSSIYCDPVIAILPGRVQRGRHEQPA
jgi:hypothetical protein